VGIFVAIVGIQTFTSKVDPQTSASVWYAIGAIFAILGLLLVVVGYGLWKARPWAWLLGLWAGVAYVVLGILTLSSSIFIIILLVGIGNLIFYYFKRTGLKLYLGKVQP
jgi:uncharacterized membrane protein (DUF2068 family)